MESRPLNCLEVAPSAAKGAWAPLIKRTQEIDPLVCPRCVGPMRIVMFIELPEIIDRILTRPGLWR